MNLFIAGTQNCCAPATEVDQPMHSKLSQTKFVRCSNISQ